MEGNSALTQLCAETNLFHVERRVADYIMEHQAETAGMTSMELARASGASEATVSRLCKKLGFSNYRAFQLSLTREVAEKGQAGQISDEISMENIGQSLKNILANKTGELTATLNAIDPGELKEVVGLLSRAQIIQVAAVGNTIPVALDAAFKFNQLGLRSVVSEISEKASAFALTLTDRDVLLLISNSGRSQRLCQLTEAARRNGVKVILITGDRNSPLAGMADHILVSSNWERLLTTKEYALSRISAIAIVEVLYSFLLVSLPGSRENIHRHEALMREDKNVR